MKKPLLLIGGVIISLSIYFFYNKLEEKKLENFKRLELVKVNKFQERFDNISNPYDLNSYTLKRMSDKNDIMYQYEPIDGIENYLKRNFRNSADEYLNLTIDMIRFKYDTIKNRQLDLNDVKIIVNDIKNKPKNKINSLIIKSLEKAIQYYSETL